MKRYILLLVIQVLMFGGCFCYKRERIEPPYPQNVSGWKYHEENGVGTVGDFVLKKGESTNNGEVEIKVVDLIPADLCAEAQTPSASDRVKLQFVRMSDKKVLCEDRFTEHGGGYICEMALDEFRIGTIGIREINIKDQWVHFFLVGDKKE